MLLHLLYFQPLYRYYYYIMKNNYDQGDESYWTDNPDALATLKDDVLNNLKSVAAIKRLAADNGVELTEEDQQTLEDAVFYISHADMLIIGGTSLAVYPASSAGIRPMSRRWKRSI